MQNIEEPRYQNMMTYIERNKEERLRRDQTDIQENPAFVARN